MTLETLQIDVTANIDQAKRNLGELDGVLAACEARLNGAKASFHSAGTNAANALASGILSRRAAVTAAASAVANAAARALRSALKIQSPSRVALEIGEFVDKGLAEGLLSGAQAVRGAAEGLGGVVEDSLLRLQNAPAVCAPSLPIERAAPAPAPAAQSIHLTVPLEIDGLRLGVAAISGINAAQRAAGRVLLDL